MSRDRFGRWPHNDIFVFPKNKTIIKIIIVILVAAGLGSYFYFDYQKSKIPENPKNEVIEQISTLRITRGDLDQETLEKYQEAFNAQKEKFLENPEDETVFWSLISIEQIKQLVGDYDGAEQALLWAAELAPKSFVVHGNLASLYFHHYQDFVKAEEHYLKALETEDHSQLTYYYLDLHEIYRYFYKKDTILAEDILKQGIERFPQETNLMAVLANYYKELGRKEEARQYYQKILEINPDSQAAKQGLENL